MYLIRRVFGRQLGKESTGYGFRLANRSLVRRCARQKRSTGGILTRIKNDPCSVLLTSAIQCLLDPLDVPRSWNGETKVLDLQGNQFERMEASAGRIQVSEIHQGKVVAVALVTTDAFIVIQEITAAI